MDKTTQPQEGFAEWRIGTVESVRYTHGGDGRQVTTIDGQTFATWWDIRTRDWREGDRVKFLACYQRPWANSSPEWQAKWIEKDRD
jgi:hypothetical protein